VDHIPTQANDFETRMLTRNHFAVAKTLENLYKTNVKVSD